MKQNEEVNVKIFSASFLTFADCKQLIFLWLVCTVWTDNTPKIKIKQFLGINTSSILYNNKDPANLLKSLRFLLNLSFIKKHEMCI